MVIREALREFGADPEAAMRRLLGDEKLFLLLLREFWNDPDIGIEWPIPEGMTPELSEKDTRWKGIREYRAQK